MDNYQIPRNNFIHYNNVPESIIVLLVLLIGRLAVSKDYGGNDVEGNFGGLSVMDT